MKEKLIVWLADIFVSALRMFSLRLHDWFFSEERQARLRFRDRKVWWRLTQKAASTKDTRDDMRAKAWQIRFAFETPPDEALARGDLDSKSRKMAMDTVEAARIAQNHGNHP